MDHASFFIIREILTAQTGEIARKGRRLEKSCANCGKIYETSPTD